MSELPEGWAEVPLAAVAEDVVAGFPCGQHSREAIGIAHLRPMNVSRNGAIDLSDVRYVDPAVNPRRVHRGDVVFNNTNSPELVGKTAVYTGPGPAAFSNHMTRIQPCDGISPSFLARQLHYQWMAGEYRLLISNHVNQASIPARRLGTEVQIRVAPTAEQGRIVAAIEEAFSLLDAGETALHNTRTRLKRMRDAVLTTAVTGRLVPQDPTDTPAARLLDDLRVQPVVAADGFLRVPDTWLWARVKDVGAVDLGRQRHPDWHTGPNMRPYLRVANVFEDRIDTSDVMEMHFEPEVFERFKVRVGDVLLNEGQSPELLGRPALYRGDPPEVAFTNSILRFRASPAVTPAWALLVFRAYMRTGRFTRESRITTNIAHLSAGRLKTIEFPVPPREEQARIVAEVERQFSFIEAAERAVETGLRRSAALRRSVLKAAFEGRLVAQDPGDEAASVLLERIAAERAAAAPRTRRAPRRVRGEAK